MKFTDLRNITRDSNIIETSVSAYMGATWEGIAAMNEWLKLGACDIREEREQGAYRLTAYLPYGVTDFEHDSAYALRLGLVGLEFATMYNGSVHLLAYIDPNCSSEFRVPEPEYNPMKLEGAYECSDCEDRHIIVPEDYYTPPFNKELYKEMRGKKIRILMAPPRNKD